MKKQITIPVDSPKWKHAIADALNERDISMKEASRAVGRGETFIRDLLKREREPSASNIKAVFEYLDLDVSEFWQQTSLSKIAISGLAVAGKVQAGNFLDVSLLQEDGDDQEVIPSASDPRHPEMSQYALLVVGDSMNEKFDDGTYVTCVAWGDTGLDFKPGMCMHVEKHQGDLVEVTLKCYAERGGKRWLDPKSTNTAHKPIELNGNEATEIIVKGLVTGSWKPEKY